MNDRLLVRFSSLSRVLLPIDLDSKSFLRFWFEINYILHMITVSWFPPSAAYSCFKFELFAFSFVFLWECLVTPPVCHSTCAKERHDQCFVLFLFFFVLFAFLLFCPINPKEVCLSNDKKMYKVLNSFICNWYTDGNRTERVDRRFLPEKVTRIKKTFKKKAKHRWRFKYSVWSVFMCARVFYKI